ncbi:MAG: hypothetical protein IJC84_01375 [Clostridia bacterium]|nr:hypothetical protein [Clostridia bacterium]
MTNDQQILETRENVLAGCVGAFLFSLAGGILWFILYQVGFMAGLSGLVGVVCAIKGYSIFAKKESIKGIVIAVLMAILVMVLAWYLCLSLDVYNAYQDWFAAGEVDFTLTYGESVRSAYLFLADSEILISYLTDLGLGLLLCVVGAYRSVIEAVKRVKQEKNPPTAPQAPENENPEDPNAF